MFDRQDYKELQERRQAKRHTGEVSAMIERAHQAAVEANALMAAPEWKVYQQLIAGTIEKLGAQELSLRDNLCDPLRVNHEDLMRLKLTLVQVIGMRTGLESALSLPRALIEDADKAEESMRKLLENQDIEQSPKA